MTIPNHKILIFSAYLPAFIRQKRKLLGLLSTDEIQRASAFRFDQDQSTYILARGLLRVILSKYMCCQAKEIVFSYGANGKPRVAATSLSFNTSHAKDLVLYALAHDCCLGIDVEWIRPIDEFEHIAWQFFAPEEYNELLSVSPEHRLEAFFNCWTRKEAYLKATGEGLSTPLKEFRVTLFPEEPAKILAIRGDHCPEWSLFHVKAGEGYIAAIAARGKSWDIEWQECPPLPHD